MGLSSGTAVVEAAECNSCLEALRFWSDVLASDFCSDFRSDFGLGFGSVCDSALCSALPSVCKSIFVVSAGKAAAALATTLLASASALLRRSSSANPGYLSVACDGGLDLRPCRFVPSSRFASRLVLASLPPLGFRSFLRLLFWRSMGTAPSAGGGLGAAFAVVA